MLYLETIPQEALGLLRSFMSAHYLSDFSLAGGTALALQLGHRVSVDLDLFSQNAFDAELLKANMVSNYGFQINGIAKNTLRGFAGNVKVDLISHQYQILNKPSIQNGIRLYSLEDIAAMKLNAICNRGTKKDFADIYSLCDVFPLQFQLGCYKKKYDQEDLLMVLKSLVYFEDAELDPDPNWLDNNLSWQKVKERIVEEMINLDL